MDIQATASALSRPCDTAPVRSEPNTPLSIWDAADRLIDLAPQLSDVQSHRIGLLAARRWRATGRPLPPELLEEERRAGVSLVMAPLVLEQVRAAYDGPVLLFKGPEVAAHYPAPELRGFSDLDLLVGDAEAAQRALVGAGFEPVGDPALYLDIHHLRPLMRPDLPLRIEIHSRPKWVERLSPPTAETLLRRGRPSRTGVDGILTLCPAEHALLLAAHSWAHEPLRRLRDLIDIAAMADEVGGAELSELARAWRIEQLWATTARALDAVLGAGPLPRVVRLWAQNLIKVRERTVLENHLQRWLSDFAVLPPATAAWGLAATFADEIRPDAGEPWREKLRRSGRALRNATLRKSEHDDQVRGGRRPLG